MSGFAPGTVRRVILVLGMLTCFGPFATDMYLSGFGDIAASLHTDIGKVQLSLSTFFLGLCCGQLLYGPLIDAFGRRGPLLAGVALFTLASLAAMLAPDIGSFIAVRFVQAVGACAGMVVSRALIHDLFHERDAARALSAMMIVQAIGPILAPVLGAWLLGFGQWRALFAFMAALGAACLVAALRQIPETLPPGSRPPLAPRAVAGAFAGLLGNRRFMVPALASSCALAQVFAFISGSPFVYMTLHGVSRQHFSWLFALNAGGLVVASQVNRWLLKRATPRTIFGWALTANLAANVALLVLASVPALAALVIPLLLALATMPLMAANGVVLAMSASGGRAGSASSIIGVLQFALASLVSAAVGLLHDGSAYPMCGLMLAASLAGMLIHVIGRARAQPVA